MEVLKMTDNVSRGGRSGYVISVVVLLCLKNCATYIRYTVMHIGNVLMCNDSKIKVEPPAILDHRQ